MVYTAFPLRVFPLKTQFFHFEYDVVGSTTHSCSISKRAISASAPSESVHFSTRIIWAGPIVIIRTPSSREIYHVSTRYVFMTAKLVSTHVDQSEASWKGFILSGSVWGAWSVVKASMSHSCIATTTASTWSLDRRGGYIFALVLYPIHSSSVRAKCCTDTSAVMFESFRVFLAILIASMDPLVELWRRWNRAPDFSARRIFFHTARSSVTSEIPGKPSCVDTDRKSVV